MESKVINVIAPEGYEIDKENSTFERIIFKPIKEVKTWENLCGLSRKEMFFITVSSSICKVDSNHRINLNTDKNFLPNKEYAEAILALCQLFLIRSYYIKDWKQDLENKSLSYRVFVKYDNNTRKEAIDYEFASSAYGTLTFPTSEMTQDFIKNNEKLILKAKLVL